MHWTIIIELDICIGFLIITFFGLSCLRYQHLDQSVIQFACVSWPLLTITNLIITTTWSIPASNITASLNISENLDFVAVITNNGYDILLAIIIIVVILSFKNFESLLLLIIAYVAQLYMIHSVDLLMFYISLEAQNFCFLVLCGLQPDKRSAGFSVEAALKYILLSALSSGVFLFSLASLYITTGITLCENTNIIIAGSNYGSGASLEVYIIILAILFKLGCAPVHLWLVYIYQSIKRPLLIYISTAPKLTLFYFWASSWQLIWIDNTLGVFIIYTLLLGSLGAYGYGGNPSVRSLFAYSTVSEMGFILLATETAGFHSLFQHLCIYILTQVMIWNLSDKRLFSVAAISLAGLPPLAGFYGKAWIIWHSASIHIVTYVMVALICSVLSIVYNIRLLRLFWNYPNRQTLSQFDNVQYSAVSGEIKSASQLAQHISHGFTGMISNLCSSKTAHQLRSASGLEKIAASADGVSLTSGCVVSLVFLPMFLLKPFVL